MNTCMKLNQAGGSGQVGYKTGVDDWKKLLRQSRWLIVGRRMTELVKKWEVKKPYQSTQLYSRRKVTLLMT